MPATANDVNGLAREYYIMRLNGVPTPLPAGVNRSGTATTTSGGLNVPANPNRSSLTGQNVSAINIGFNEFGGVAAVPRNGAPGPTGWYSGMETR